MAVKQHTLSFKKASVIKNEEDGQIYLEEVSKDSVQTFNLSEELESFIGAGRVVDITIRENFDIEGSVE